MNYPRYLSSPRIAVPVLLLVLLGVAPAAADVLKDPFLVVFLSRALILAIAAVSLDFVMGFAGIVSLGHALFIGLGAYVVGIMSVYGITNGWLHLGLTVLLCGSIGLATGMIVVRQTGLSLIMITLTFAQMFYYLATGLKRFGGDDGLSIQTGSNFYFFTLDHSRVLYYVAFFALVSLLVLGLRASRARFGMVLQGCRMNERRMCALGYSTTQYKVVAYVLSSVVCGIAGMLYANLTHFVSPSYATWTMSGDLLVMVVLGGVGSLIGPVLGTFSILIIEEILKGYTDHWMIIYGPLVVLFVLLTRKGIYGMLSDINLHGGRTEAHMPTSESKV